MSWTLLFFWSVSSRSVGGSGRSGRETQHRQQHQHICLGLSWHWLCCRIRRNHAMACWRQKQKIGHLRRVSVTLESQRFLSTLTVSFGLLYTCRCCIMHMKWLTLNLKIFHNHSAWNQVSWLTRVAKLMLMLWNCNDKVKCMLRINEWWGSSTSEKIPSGAIWNHLCIQVWTEISVCLHHWFNALEHSKKEKHKNIQV